MLIKFKKPDPRAGTVAQMDSSRGQFFVDNGSAEKIREDGGGSVQGQGGKPVLVRADLDAALAALPGENDDPEYVVRSMRMHFGDLFTEADEERVRAVVKTRATKPSDGLTVTQLKEALDAKKIPIPDGAKKPELVALLDGAA